MHTSNPACHISWPEWVALARIHQRQWFSRAWIVQEAILPSVLLMHTGPDALSWALLGDVSAVLRRNEAKPGTASFTAFVPEQDAAVPIVWNMAEVSKRRQTKCHANRKDITNAHESRALFTPREMVYTFRTFAASDPRDKIFAFYRVLNLSSEAARKMIREQGNLQTLSACVHPSDREDGEPADLGLRLQPARYQPHPEPTLRERRTLHTHRPKDGGPAKLDAQGTRRGAVSRASGRRGTRLSEKFLFGKSWLSMLPSLRGNGEHGPHPNLPEVPWRTMCMDMPYGSQFDPEAYGSHVPAEFAGQFRVFMLLVILSDVDGLILQDVNMPVSTENTTTFSYEC
ncbi:hypothetical protein MHUMG1_08854 [Metarhizium humberi]|uniref:Heterokaryon incompatibility domain-containing protein n=1 Tax=Metarhizium humberi TaxID=2596975 RepID=A0A9P8M4K9_9HYPO|nr:hypothetical protein MHUMG1_08854 [Metarhizium humberi]